MMELKTRVAVSKQYLGAPCYLVDGDGRTGNRRLAVTIPVLDEAGNRIELLSKEYGGAEFAAAWAGFETDEGMIAKVLADLGLEADLSAVEGDIVNGGN